MARAGPFRSGLPRARVRPPWKCAREVCRRGRTAGGRTLWPPSFCVSLLKKTPMEGTMLDSPAASPPGASCRSCGAGSARLRTGVAMPRTWPRSGTVNLKRWWRQRDSSVFVSSTFVGFYVRLARLMPTCQRAVSRNSRLRSYPLSRDARRHQSRPSGQMRRPCPPAEAATRWLHSEAPASFADA